MKNIYKLISMLLTVFMILSALTVLFTVDVFAAEETEQSTESSAETSTENGTGSTQEGEKAKESVDYINQFFATPEEKLETMDLAYEKDGIRLYVDEESGEVAYVNTKTGEKLFTNPYDVASSTGAKETKYEILSQIIVTFTDSEGQERVFTSFEQAAERGQIVIESIKGGVRVEYTIGREQSKILVPRLISMDRFEEMILAPLLEKFGDELYNPRSTNTDVFEVQKMLSYFLVYSVDELDLSKKERQNMENTYGGLYDDLISSDAQYARALKKFPIIETMPVYVFDPDASEKELSNAEAIIAKYCPEYTYEELEYDHILTEYKSDDANPPVFRMALEYKVEDDGLSVRLPANGIRFNESLYTLENIEVLPYMGAGNSAYDGYNFFPDGSGALFEFQDLNTNQTRAVSAKVYGTDFAYHEIEGTYQKTIRYPVFGVVENTKYYTFTKYDKESGDVVSETKIAGNIVDAITAQRDEKKVNFCVGQTELLYTEYSGTITASQTIKTETIEKRGFVCIIEEGDALASISTYHAGPLSDYNTVKMQFTPRPKDSYNISDSISVGANSEWTVVSDRKYVGNYLMKYIPLSDAEQNKDSYDASWFGMAVAYRDYLTNNGIISKLTEEELTRDIPLYIETFGTIETTEKILSIPVTVMAPLTTFKNINDMYDELAKQGMKNINFKLTGYANGGMQYTMPGRLKFEKAVGGNKDFQNLLDKADYINEHEDRNFGVFPDFDFAYVNNSDLFDGHSALKHNAQTIDGRYASKKQYSATQQKYENFYEMVISPAYFAEFYEKLTKNYADKYENVLGISVSTLGTALNTDFDEDEPYNREDAKEFTVEAFKHFSDNYSQVMTDGGNAYTWQYVDHILGAALDSSRYNFSAEAVPFIGVVLHGSIRFAGEPLNMEGDLKYAILKAIENGASPYFILSYQNTQVLKEDERLSKYYSIRYDIWSDDILDTYSTLNGVLFDVQDKYITNHEFLSGATRVPDSDELMADIYGEYEATLEAQRNAAELLQKELERAANIARENGRVAEEYAAEAIIKVLDIYASQMKFVSNSAFKTSDYYKHVKDAYGAYYEVMSLRNSTDPEEKALFERMSLLYDVVSTYNRDFNELSATYDLEYTKYELTLLGADFKNHSKIIADVYSSYAKRKITAAQIESEIAAAVAEDIIVIAIQNLEDGKISAADFVKIVEKYGVAYVDTSVISTAVMNYMNGQLDTAALSEIAALWGKNSANKKDPELKAKFEATLEAYLNGTLAESALDDTVTEFFATLETSSAADLKAAAEKYKAGDIKKKALETAISSYAASLLDQANIQQRMTALKNAKNALEIAENNYTLESITDNEVASAQKKYDSAKKTFDKDVETFMSKFRVSTFEKAITKFDETKDAYDEVIARQNLDKTDAEAKYNAALAAYAAAETAAAGYLVGSMDETSITDSVADYKEKADAYAVYLAGSDAFDAIIQSGFQYDYDYCYNIYYQKYSHDKYSSFTNILKLGEYSDEDYALFNAYYSADIAAGQLDDLVKNSVSEAGRFDNYVVALAQYDYIIELGDKVSEEELTRALNLLEQTRRTAVTNVAAIDSSTIEEMKTIYETALEHVELAVAAIEVLALSENYTIEYEDDEIQNLTTIKISDDMPFIVKQAVERAQTAYYYIVDDRIEVIEDGILTDYYHEGHRLYRTRLASSGETVYFYGTYEEGYQYLAMNKDGKTFSVYEKNKSNAGGNVNGNIVYENVKNDFGKGVYFTIADGKMTYYTKVADGVYVKKAPIVYNGTLFKTLENGTEIYKDGDIYYSINEDGTYTRYTYSQCIESCYNDSLREIDRVFEIVEAVQNNAEASDNQIFDDIKHRISINKLLDGVEEEEEVVEEDTKYNTENVVAVTYGNEDGSPYKTIILNYNNYAIRIEYEDRVYTIPAYGFVNLKYKK